MERRRVAAHTTVFTIDSCDQIFQGPLDKILQAVALLNDAAAHLGSPERTTLSTERGTLLRAKTSDSRDTEPARSGRVRNSDQRDIRSGLRSSDRLEKDGPKLLPRWREMDESRLNDAIDQCMLDPRQSHTHSINMRDTVRSLVFYADERESGSCIAWAIPPSSRQRITWDVLSVIFITYDLLLVPLFTFDLTSIRDVIEIMDWGVVLFWSLDIIMSFRTGFYNKQSIVLNPKEIAMKYARSWMLLDMIIVALEWAACMSMTAGGANAARFHRLRVVARYARGTRSLKLVEFMTKFLSGMRSFYLLLCFSLAKITVGLLLVCHYFSCGWHAVGKSSSDGWVNQEDVKTETLWGLVYMYTSAARWTLAQINGRTDLAEDRNFSERGYTTLCAFFTVVFHSLYISALTTRMVELLGARSEMRKGIRVLNEFVHRHKLSRSTMHFARQYVMNHSQLKSEAETEKALLDLLPDHLQMDLVYEVRTPTLVHHPFMKDLNHNYKPAFRHMLASAVGNVYTRRLEVVFEPDMPCQRVLWHAEGQLRYESNYTVGFRDGLIKEPARNLQERVRVATGVLRQQSHLDEGLDFGEEVPLLACLSEAALWIEWKHKGALVSVAVSHLLALDVKKFCADLVHHVDAESRAAVYAVSFIRKCEMYEISDLMEKDFGALDFDLHVVGNSLSLESYSQAVSVIPAHSGGQASKVPSICQCGNKLMSDTVSCRKCGRQNDGANQVYNEIIVSSGVPRDDRRLSEPSNGNSILSL